MLPNGHIQAFIVLRIRLPWPMHKSVIECELEFGIGIRSRVFPRKPLKAKSERLGLKEVGLGLCISRELRRK